MQQRIHDFFSAPNRKSWFLIHATFVVNTYFATAQDLIEYTALSERLNISAYLDPESPEFSFDERGIILRDKQYHPVNTATFGIACFEKFEETGDSTLLRLGLNQIQYFKDSSFYNVAFNGKGVAYLYKFDWKDLPAPWYSGMAQGEAVSYLLRYRKYTGDVSVDSLCKKIAYFMIQDEHNGGTISVLENGGLWIREYPRSEIYNNVLNGSINGLIGLYEYCQVFDQDKNAQKVLDVCLETMKDNVSMYNMPEWSCYDQAYRICSPKYLRYHNYLLRELYKLTNEEVYLNQMMLWSAFAHGAPYQDSLEIFKDEDYPLAIRFWPNETDWNLPRFDLEPELKRRGISGKITETDHLKQLEHTPSASTRYMIMQFEEAVDIDYITFHFEGLAQSPDIALYSINAEGILHKLDIKGQHISTDYWRGIVTDSVETSFQTLVLAITSDEVARLGKTQIGIYNSESFLKPWFGFYKTTPLEMRQGVPYSISVKTDQIDNLKVFYRHTEKKEEVNFSFFSPDTYLVDATFVPEETGFYQFYIIFEMKNMLSTAGGFIYQEN